MSPTWHLTDPPDEVALLRARVSHLAMRLDEARDDIDAQAHALTAHAVAWVTAAERLGLEVREEEPEETMRRVLAALEELRDELAAEHDLRCAAEAQLDAIRDGTLLNCDLDDVAECVEDLVVENDHLRGERAAIVAWLRSHPGPRRCDHCGEYADTHPAPYGDDAGPGAWRDEGPDNRGWDRCGEWTTAPLDEVLALADAIERGEHVGEGR